MISLFDTPEMPIWQPTAGIGCFCCARCGIFRYCKECGSPVAGMRAFVSCSEHRMTLADVRAFADASAPLDYHERCHLVDYAQLIITDPPWNYDAGITNAKQKQLVEYQTLADFAEMFKVFAATLMPDRNLWVFTDWFNQIRMVEAAQAAGLHYEGFTVVKRKRLGMGYKIRKNVYLVLLFAKGKAVYPKRGLDYIPEYLGEYDCTRSHKDPAIYARLARHSLTGLGGATWIDPFPATHEEAAPVKRTRKKKTSAPLEDVAA